MYTLKETEVKIRMTAQHNTILKIAEADTVGVALLTLNPGDRARVSSTQGAHVHSHNPSGEGQYDRKSARVVSDIEVDHAALPESFMRYARCGITEAPTLKSFTIQEAGGTRKSTAKSSTRHRARKHKVKSTGSATTNSYAGNWARSYSPAAFAT